MQVSKQVCVLYVYIYTCLNCHDAGAFIARGPDLRGQSATERARVRPKLGQAPA